MLSLVLVKRTLQMQCLSKNSAIADCQLHFLLFCNVIPSVFSVTALCTAKVKIVGGYNLYLPKALHNLVTAVNAGNLNAGRS